MILQLDFLFRLLRLLLCLIVLLRLLSFLFSFFPQSISFSSCYTSFFTSLSYFIFLFAASFIFSSPLLPLSFPVFIFFSSTSFASLPFLFFLFPSSTTFRVWSDYNESCVFVKRYLESTVISAKETSFTRVSIISSCHKYGEIPSHVYSIATSYVAITSQ
jgi:hypothetical protein